MWGPWNATSRLTLSSRNPWHRSLCKRDKYFNWQNVALNIVLSFSSEWLDRLILQRFKVQRYGIPKWARWCYRNEGLAVFKKYKTLQNACSTSAVACCEHCILVQQKSDTLVVFTNSVLHQSVRSEFMFQTSKLVSRDISIVSIFIQFLCPCL